MVSEQVEESDSRGTIVDPKKSEVSCWNCFTTVAAETATPPEPATLPKIRQETRQKYKLYSFLASQISRPKAIPLTQKVSENYAIGKKVEQKITEKAVQTNITQIEKIKHKDIVPDKLESSTEPEIDISRPDVSVPETKPDKEKKIQDYIREYHLFEAYKSIRRKTPTPNSTLERTKNNVTLDNSDLPHNNTCSSIENVQSPNYKKLEIVQPKVTIRKVYESPSISITSNTYITKSQENLDDLDSKSPQSKPRVGKEETQTSQKLPPTVTQRTSLTKQDKIVPNLEFKSSFPSPRSRTQSNSSLTKSNSPNNSPKAQHFACKSLKIEDKNKGKSKSIPNMPLVSPRKLTPTSSNENIVNKIHIETSTPKDSKTKPIDQDTKSKTIKTEDDIDTIIEGIQNISLEIKEQRVSDKTDNASLNESESGYSGSSTRDLPESDIGVKNVGSSRQSTESGVESDSPQLSHKIPRLHFKSSLPVLASRHKNMSISTKSLAAESNTEVNKPVKKLRWSTLGLPHDEVYLSDSASPGHATLPRRSNSPLPHERDLLDRDSRFSLNRSGLQNRSESMASVYSGAGEGTRCNVTVRGEIQFSLLYNYRLGALEVGVKRCRDLAPVDTKRNRSDPYVKMYLLPDKSKAGKRKTKVKKNTLSPVFEETLSFVQPLSSLSGRTLWLSVWHADMFGRNDFLGEVTLPLADVVFDDPAPMWYKLHERTEQFDEQQGTRGDLILGLKLEVAETGAAKGACTLHVLVKEAKNLVATKPGGLADVFCKSYLLPERGRLVKQKTSVSRRTLNPRWEQTFTYRGLKREELAARALELSLWDRDRLASNDFMGAVRLSLGTGTYMGASVNWMDSVGKEVSLWQTMLERPNFWVEGSLPLRPQLNN